MFLCCREAEDRIIKLPFSQRNVSVSVRWRASLWPVAHAWPLMEGVKSAGEETGVATGGVYMDICRPLEGEGQRAVVMPWKGLGSPPPVIPIL